MSHCDSYCGLCLELFRGLTDKQWHREFVLQSHSWRYRRSNMQVLHFALAGCIGCRLFLSWIRNTYDPENDGWKTESLKDCELFEVNSVFITARGRRIDDSAWNNIEEVIFYLEIGRGTCKFDSQGECISDLHIWPTVQFESTYERVHRFRATAKDDDPAAEFVSNRKKVWLGASDIAFNEINAMITECNESHTCYGQSQDISRPLPKIVVDVDLYNQPPKPRLRISKGESEPYIALSYCWGDQATQPVTTTDNLASRCKIIEVPILPKTIQDAIQCCRRLGVAFLWCDSLCIIQDSEEEKASQINNMGNVYKNAYLCISAARAASSHDGFLEDGPSMETLKIPYRCPNQRFGTLILERDLGSLPEEEPTDKRAWTLQEIMLSRRVLSYGTKKFSWRCQKSRDPIRNETDIVHSLFHSPEPKSYSISWPKIVRSFTSREITYISDRLPAISAIASALIEQAAEPQTDYVAGLWRRNLEVQLLWVALKPGPPREHKEATGPSWSWASVRAPISIPSLFARDKLFLGNSNNILTTADEQNDSTSYPYFQLLEWSTIPIAGSGPFGRIVRGYLKVKGLILRTKMSPEQGSAPAEFHHQNLEPIGGITPFLDTHGTDGYEQDVWLLAVSPSKGLILECVTCDNVQKTYRRLGMFELSDRVASKGFLFGNLQNQEIVIV